MGRIFLFSPKIYGGFSKWKVTTTKIPVIHLFCARKIQTAGTHIKSYLLNFCRPKNILKEIIVFQNFKRWICDGFVLTTARCGKLCNRKPRKDHNDWHSHWHNLPYHWRGHHRRFFTNILDHIFLWHGQVAFPLFNLYTPPHTHTVSAVSRVRVWDPCHNVTYLELRPHPVWPPPIFSHP